MPLLSVHVVPLAIYRPSWALGMVSDVPHKSLPLHPDFGKQSNSSAVKMKILGNVISETSCTDATGKRPVTQTPRTDGATHVVTQSDETIVPNWIQNLRRLICILSRNRNGFSYEEVLRETQHREPISHVPPQESPASRFSVNLFVPSQQRKLVETL